ncbi:ATP-binding cassette domain-containing protein [Collinsella intestinalis]|uniref:ATP-binding cassette domain-containing protein n=1 Tax=Collinsella intestinalis TaxID=147207 RepID=UPI00195BC1B7|nr:ATP-binding cassette domain-containing protein [Collinsella intestinalis]MBM6683840.1 ATP-binding cassette domain-containing protein [Collinsella intestinalis]
MERESVRNSAENSGALVATTPTPAPPAPAPVHAYTAPTHIEVRGARVHNLKNINVDIPLGCLVGIAGVSGSGKSSLALGTLYAEGSRRYLDALSTYTRRRIGQVGRATVDEVRHVPAALALRQRPGIPGVHSTFGTSTELLNYLRLMFSRLGSHQCPHCGTHVPPSMDVALMRPATCPSCGQEFYGPGAEDLAFNSAGACTTCGGTGIVRTVDESTLVPDESLSIEEGAVASWQQLMWKLMRDIAREMGVRTDVPFRDLTPEEREIVFHGPAEKHHMFYQSSKTGDVGEMDFTYFNAVYTVENALSKVKDEKGLARLAKFLKEDVCPDCHGTRLNARARGPVIDGMNLGEATRMTLDELAAWVPGVPALMPEAMRPMAQSIVAEMAEPIERLKQLGLGYLSLDRASSTLSTGERQRVQLARAVRNRTCGVLYVLDEPSIGLHPSNVEGLLGVMDDLLADGNSVVLVDHDVRVLRHADHLVEIGPGSGTAGGSVIAQGSVEEVEQSSATRIGPFLSGARRVRVRERAAADEVFARGAVRLETGAIHTVKPLAVEVPRGRLTAVTGVSGSGKTTLVLESLIPGLRAAIAGEALPGHVRSVDPGDLRRVHLIDATPIGANVRSTVATYSGVLDDLRRAFAKTPAARERGLKAGAFSYNTGSLRCPTCDGTGQISLDVQFLPDVDIPCPDCQGGRYRREALDIKLAGDLSLPELMSYTVDQAREVLGGLTLKSVLGKLQTLSDLGLGYLTLGEATPALSGGEAQRLKLASELTRDQADALFVFDEPTIGLHPLDVEVLLGVLERLIANGATVVVIEHDLDMIANADWVIDMGPGGGDAGGRVVCAGTPEQVTACVESVTGRYIAEELA